MRHWPGIDPAGVRLLAVCGRWHRCKGLEARLARPAAAGEDTGGPESEAAPCGEDRFRQPPSREQVGVVFPPACPCGQSGKYGCGKSRNRQGFWSPGRRKQQADRQGGKIEARRGRDSARGSMRSTRARSMGVLSRNRRKFRQPINVACPAPGRWGRPNSRVTSRHFDHGNASRTSRPDCSGLDEAD